MCEKKLLKDKMQLKKHQKIIPSIMVVLKTVARPSTVKKCLH
jgi:hypothetical protein